MAWSLTHVPRGEAAHGAVAHAAPADVQPGACMRMHAAAAGGGRGVPQGGKDHGVQGTALRGGRTVQTYTLEVIEARPEEGGGGAVRATQNLYR